MTDQPADLRHLVAAAIHHYDQRNALSGNDMPSQHHYGEADAVLTVLEAAGVRDAARQAAGQTTKRRIVPVCDQCAAEWTTGHTCATRQTTTTERAPRPVKGRVVSVREEPVELVTECAMPGFMGCECNHLSGCQHPAPAVEQLVQVGWWCWRGNPPGHLATQACRSDNVPIHVPAEWADDMTAVIQRLEDDDDAPEPAVEQPAEAQPARNDLYDALDQSWYRWGRPDKTNADSLNRLIDAYRDEVAIDIGRDALRDGLRPFLARLVGEPTARTLLAAYRAVILRETASDLDAFGYGEAAAFLLRMVEDSVRMVEKGDGTWVPRYGRPLSPEDQAAETHAAADEGPR